MNDNSCSINNQRKITKLKINYQTFKQIITRTTIAYWCRRCTRRHDDRTQQQTQRARLSEQRALRAHERRRAVDSVSHVQVGPRHVHQRRHAINSLRDQRKRFTLKKKNSHKNIVSALQATNTLPEVRLRLASTAQRHQSMS